MCVHLNGSHPNFYRPCLYLVHIVRHRNQEYQPKRAIASIENVSAFFEKGYIVNYKT